MRYSNQNELYGIIRSSFPTTKISLEKSLCDFGILQEEIVDATPFIINKFKHKFKKRGYKWDDNIETSAKNSFLSGKLLKTSSMDIVLDLPKIIIDFRVPIQHERRFLTDAMKLYLLRKHGWKVIVVYGGTGIPDEVKELSAKDTYEKNIVRVVGALLANR